MENNEFDNRRNNIDIIKKNFEDEIMSHRLNNNNNKSDEKAAKEMFHRDHDADSLEGEEIDEEENNNEDERMGKEEDLNEELAQQLKLSAPKEDDTEMERKPTATIDNNTTNISSCNTSTTSVSSSDGGNIIVNDNEEKTTTKMEEKNSEMTSSTVSMEKASATSTASSCKPVSSDVDVASISRQSSSKSPTPDEDQELYDAFDQSKSLSSSKNTNTMTTTIKRTHLLNLIFELYDLNESQNIAVVQTDSSQDSTSAESSPSKQQQQSSPSSKIVIESYMEKLPPGKNLKNSILLAWKRKYFRLNSLGMLYVHDIDEKKGGRYRDQPDEVYNIMGGRVDYEQNKIVSLDDCRGNYLVFRCCPDIDIDDQMFLKWREAIDAQIIDRSHALWVRPNQSLSFSDHSSIERCANKNVVIIDIGTCSIRAGLFDIEPKLPKLFVPTVCSKDTNGKLRVGFDAFDFLLGSSAPSTIDLRKSMSAWSLSSSHSNQLVFPFKTRVAIDKLGIDMESVEAIVSHVVENLNIACENHEVIIVTTHKLSDKVNVQFLNILLNEESRFRFKGATIINQTLMDLYAYNSNIGVIANLGEKIDIVPICNGLPFQNGVTNLAYGGSCMSDFLNCFISRGHVNYVNDMEQFYIRYIKEKSCYAALNYQDELKKYPNDSTKYTMELKGRLNEFKKVEFPESARFKAVEGLFNPEIWGLDGQGIHKLIQKAIQSSSMDLRREMARSIYLCGGMSRIPGLKERLEKELKLLFPPNLTIKVNCSDYSYHSAYLGAFRFIQQPEYEKLMIRREEWASENVNCLRKWRSI